MDTQDRKRKINHIDNDGLKLLVRMVNNISSLEDQESEINSASDTEAEDGISEIKKTFKKYCK